MVFAQAAARGSEWGGGLVIDRSGPTPVRPKDLESVTARMRSGSGGSRTTATSDSGDFDSVGLAPNVAASLSSLSSSASHHPRQPPQFLHSPPQRSDNISSAGSNGTFSAPSPGPSQSLSLNPPPQASLSPIVNRMRERDADEMEKYMRRNRSGSAGTSSTDNKSQAGPTFGSGGPSASGDELDGISSLAITGTTAPRRLLRPSFSAAQLRTSPSPVPIPTQPGQSDAFRNRAGTNPSSARPGQPSLSPTPIVCRASSSDYPRYEEKLAEEPEIYAGPSTQYAHFPEPPRKSNRGASSSAAAAITRRLPFNLLSKPPPPPPPEHRHSGHRRGSSTTSIRG